MTFETYENLWPYFLWYWNPKEKKLIKKCLHTILTSDCTYGPAVLYDIAILKLAAFYHLYYKGICLFGLCISVAV